MNKRQIGAKGENVARAYLISHSYDILAQNVYTPYGEIDLIGEKAGQLYFIEVKWRNSNRYGMPIEAMTPKKVKHFRQSTLYYLKHLEHFVNAYHLSFIGIMPKEKMTRAQLEENDWQLEAFEIQFLKDIDG